MKTDARDGAGLRSVISYVEMISVATSHPSTRLVCACVRACARACVRAYGRVCVFKIVTAECFAAAGILEGLNTVFIQPGDINHAGVARPVAKFMSVGYVPLAEA